MRQSLPGLLLALSTAAAVAAQPPDQPIESRPRNGDRWVQTEEHVGIMPAGIVFPRRAGAVTAVQTGEFSQRGAGVDNAIQYRSSDDAIFATVYIYLPGLAHSGLTAFATDLGMRGHSSTPVGGGEIRVVAAGAVPGAAIRRDYSNYRGRNASSAAFIKADRWMVKLRVTGPEARQAEIMAVMDALLAGARFGASARPRPAAPVDVRNCATAGGGSTARLLPDPAEGEIAAHALLATFDGAGPAATNEQGNRQHLASRVPARFCLSRQARIGDSSVPILRAASDPEPGIAGRTLLVAVLNDAGGLVEIVHAETLGRYWLFRHSIGETALMGSYDGVPSDDQIVSILSGRNPDEGRVRASVRFNPDGREQIDLPAPDRRRTAMAPAN